MAQYIFVKTRKAEDDIIDALSKVCNHLTPNEIKEQSQNFVDICNDSSGTYYAIQNSDGVALEKNGALIIGWVDEIQNVYDENSDIKVNGSYAIIKHQKSEISFFCDQFGSRTLWYYLDEDKLIVSTSQRAIIALKKSYNLNEECIAWYLSSGSQGPFISWDQDIVHVDPKLKYIFNVHNWSMGIKEKNLELTKSGVVSTSEFNKYFVERIQTNITKNLKNNSKNKTLLPISGGFDSRLLLGIIKFLKLDESVDLVNWGVDQNLYDDKKAAVEISKSYKKRLLSFFLPKKIVDFNKVLDSFVERSEGRIDHFNAFADDFDLWREIKEKNYTTVIRGDIPYPTGLHLNTIQARQKIGLERLEDYSNFDSADFDQYKILQRQCNISRHSRESYIRWRDRLYISWRVPLVLSSFTQLICPYTENIVPMMDWEVFNKYMGISDKNKGNKLHVYKAWKEYDCTGVPCKALPSLQHMDMYFYEESGKTYLIEQLELISQSNNFLNIFSSKVVQEIKSMSLPVKTRRTLLMKIKRILSKSLPAYLKFYLKAKQPMRISHITVAYRLILINKILKMYEKDARFLNNTMGA